MLHTNTPQWYEKSLLIFLLTVRIQLSKHQPIMPHRVYKLTWSNCLGFPGGYLHPQPGCPKAFNWDKMTFSQLNWSQNPYIFQNLFLFSSKTISIQPVQNEFVNTCRLLQMCFSSCLFLLCSLPVKEGKNNFRVSWKVFIKAASRRLFSNYKSFHKILYFGGKHKPISRQKTIWKLKKVSFTAKPEFLWYKHISMRLPPCDRKISWILGTYIWATCIH